MKLSRIEGVGPVYAAKLAQQGIRNTDGLLEVGSTRTGRRNLARQTGLSEKMILNWVNLADLMRVKGIGEEYSDLLEAAGVDTTRELRNRNPVNLHQTLRRINIEKNLVRRVPALSQVERWVREAKALIPLVTH